jgi:hypothetical protein
MGASMPEETLPRSEEPRDLAALLTEGVGRMLEAPPETTTIWRNSAQELLRRWLALLVGVGVLDVPFTLPAAAAKRRRGSRRSTCLTSGPPGRSARHVGESGCHGTTSRRRVRSNSLGQPLLSRNRLPGVAFVKRSEEDRASTSRRIASDRNRSDPTL